MTPNPERTPENLVQKRVQLHGSLDELKQVKLVLSSQAGELLKKIFHFWLDNYSKQLCSLRVGDELAVKYAALQAVKDFLEERLNSFESCDMQIKTIESKLMEIDNAIRDEDARRAREEQARF